MFDYGNLIHRASNYSVLQAQSSILLVLATLKQRQYTRAIFRNLLVLTHHGSVGLQPLVDIAHEHQNLLNEEVGEQLLSVLTRIVMGESNRSSYVIARRKYLNITHLSTIFDADIPIVRRFVESRTSRTTVTEATPELEIAKNFLTKMVKEIAEDTWRAYPERLCSPACSWHAPGRRCSRHHRHKCGC